MSQVFDHLIIIGRPAAGKSEFIDFLKKVSDSERAEKYHIAHFHEIDDFPWLWEKFLEDNLWEEAGYERIFSEKEGNNMGLKASQGKLFDLMFIKFNKEIEKRYLSRGDFYGSNTLFIEFSRGMDFGYAHSLPLLDKKILERAAILYIEVDGEESWRRNEARYQEKLKHSILAHKCARHTFEAFYIENDWKKITSSKRSGQIEINGIKIPFVTVNNCPESTDPKVLEERYGPSLRELMKLYRANEQHGVKS